jgi:hypothetical protein
MPDQFVEVLTRAVQRNCDIVDARHGAEMGMCAYLLKMREYFRWERGFGFTERLPHDEIGDWLSSREELWETLMGADFRPIRIDGENYDPFDADGINAALEPHGLVYSGGLVGAGRPHFFLAHLERVESAKEGYSVRVCDRELARGLSAPPAMTRERSIFLRREALRRYLWERMEIWRWNSPRNALARAFACYDFAGDVEGALDAMAEKELQTALQHEIGEVQVTVLLGDIWHDMLRTILGTPAELMARTVQNYLADSLRTLPHLAALEEEAPVHFYVGSLTGVRKEIFPGLLQAYEEWHLSRDYALLAAVAQAGRDHWLEVARGMLDLYLKQGGAAAGPIPELVRDNHL